MTSCNGVRASGNLFRADAPQSFDRSMVVLKIVGVTILLASMLKIADFATHESEASLSRSVVAFFCVAIAEMIVGCWLLLLRPSSRMYFTVLFVLCVFAFVSLGMWFAGEKVCTCFGSLSVSPALSLFFDICAIAALVGSKIQLRLLYIDFFWISFCPLIGSVCAIACVGFLAHTESSDASYADYAGHEQELPRKPDSNLWSVVQPLVGYDRDLELPLNATINSTGELNDILAPSGCRFDIITLEKVAPSVENGACVLVKNSNESYSLIVGIQDADGVWCFEVLKEHQAPNVWPVEELTREVTGAWIVNCDEASRPGLVSSESLVRFGIIPFGADIQKAVVFRNNSDSAINIKQVRTSCSCVKARLDGNSTCIDPGGSVELIINLASVKNSFRHVAEVLYEDLDRKKEKAVRLDLVGSQICKGEVVPPRIDFGRYSAETSRTIRVSEALFSRFTILRVDTGELPIDCKISEKMQSNNFLKDYLICCKLQPMGLAEGRYVGAIKVFTSVKNPSFWEIPVSFELKLD
jgi:hypothetical protein